MQGPEMLHDTFEIIREIFKHFANYLTIDKYFCSIFFSERFETNRKDFVQFFV